LTLILIFFFGFKNFVISVPSVANFNLLKLIINFLPLDGGRGRVGMKMGFFHTFGGVGGFFQSGPKQIPRCLPFSKGDLNPGAYLRISS
jgi:hypothetical protein